MRQTSRLPHLTPYWPSTSSNRGVGPVRHRRAPPPRPAPSSAEKRCSNPLGLFAMWPAYPPRTTTDPPSRPGPSADDGLPLRPARCFPRSTGVAPLRNKDLKVALIHLLLPIPSSRTPLTDPEGFRANRVAPNHSPLAHNDYLLPVPDINRPPLTRS